MKRKEAKEKIKKCLKENLSSLIPTCNFYYKNPDLKNETAKWIEVLKKHNKTSKQIELIDEKGYKEESFKPASYYSRSKYVRYYASNLGRIIAVEIIDEKEPENLKKQNCMLLTIIINEGITQADTFTRKNGNEVRLGQMSVYTLVADAWLEKKKDNEQTHHIYNDIRDNRADNLINLPREIHALCHKELSEKEYNN